MKIVGVMGYHWRRRRLFTLFFIAGIVLIGAVTAGVMIYQAPTVTAIDLSGHVVQQRDYSRMAFRNDPSSLMSSGAFSFLIFVLTMVTLNKDRRFLVSLSVPRFQILLGTACFLFAMSLLLALLGGWILPMLMRAVLLLIGFPLAGGWGQLLTGGSENLVRDLFCSFCAMICMVGVWSLAGYIALRWWKPLLILAGAGIVLLILLVSMVQWQTVIADLATNFVDWARWFVQEVLPAIVRFFEEADPVRNALIQLGAGVVCAALCYPVMRGMKVS